MNRHRWLPWASSIITIVALAVLAPAVEAQPPHVWVRPPNHPGAPATYQGTFADPSVVRVGDAYVAYASNTGGSHLPVLRSTDLKNWTPLLSYNRTTVANRARDSGSFLRGRPVHIAKRPDTAFDPWINDGLLDIHDGALRNVEGHNHLRSGYWSPGVAKIGSEFVAFSSVPQSSTDRRCIRVSVSATATGPFRPVGGSKWLQCDHKSKGVALSPNGSNDPDPFVDANGTPYLIWKSEGNPNPPFSPTVIWARKLNSEGTGFAPGSTKRELLRTARPWEGTVIENPSMVKFKGRYYLFYSGNEWVDDSYATGYAICDGPLGPCKRPQPGPLMSSSGRFVGPGGGDAFVDADGKLRLAFHHWVNGTLETRPNTAYRALAVVTLSVQANGRLSVGQATRPRPTPTPARIPALPSIPGPPPAVVARQAINSSFVPPPPNAPSSPRQNN